MEEKNRTCAVQYIPASPCVVLSEMVKYELLRYVPAGRLTTNSAMLKYLAKLFNQPRAEFEYEPFKMAAAMNSEKFRKEDNSHRMVSDGGFVDPGSEEKLRAEGFEVIPSPQSKYSLKVKDFKKYLFDFEKECPLTREMLAEYQINRRNLDDILEQVFSEGQPKEATNK